MSKTEMNRMHEEKGPTSHSDSLIEQANTIYLEIERHYQSIQNDLAATSNLHVMQTVNTLNTLLHQARLADSCIADALDNGSAVAASTNDLMEKRAAILHRLYQANRDIAGRAKNVQSLLRHERASLKTNQKAINGYKPMESSRKNIIQTSY